MQQEVILDWDHPRDVVLREPSKDARNKPGRLRHALCSIFGRRTSKGSTKLETCSVSTAPVSESSDDSTITNLHDTTHLFRKFLKVYAEQASLEHCFEIVLNENDNGNLPSMAERLLDAGVYDFTFVADYVSKEVPEDVRRTMFVDDEAVAHVKTGVWQVQCYDDETGDALDPTYAVTGVAMTDRVDTKKLLRLLFPTRPKRKPKLRMAPTDIAERLVGFRSGTMAPICHLTNMPVFLDESAMSRETICVGSGIFGKCLSMPTETFLRVAESNPKGLTVSEIVRSRKNL